MIPYKLKHSDLCGGGTPLVCRACAQEEGENNKPANVIFNHIVFFLVFLAVVLFLHWLSSGPPANFDPYDMLQ